MGRAKLAIVALVLVAAVAVLVHVTMTPPAPPPPPPAWAFPVAKPAAKRGPDDGTLLHLPGSSVAFTRSGVENRFRVPDWFPEDHPALPRVVAEGAKPKVAACGYCHLPNGQGRPENAPLAGQPAAYIVQQVQEMASGRRHSSQPKMGPPKGMVDIAKNVTPADLKAAAGYFSSLTYKPWIRVVETATVPKTAIDSHSMLAPIKGAGSEPLGMRIIETAEDFDRTDVRDSRSGFVAYVPPGSIARGEALVRSGAGGQPCRACHGPQLKGMSGTPAIAGRSPSYLTRQLFDIQYGARSGPAVTPMRAVTAHLDDAKRIDIVAYLASIKP